MFINTFNNNTTKEVKNMTINLQDVKTKLVTAISDPRISTAYSPLTRLGAQPISYGVDSIYSLRMGGSQTIKEGETKEVQAAGQVKTATVRGKNVLMFTASKEAVEGDDSNFIARLVSAASKQVISDVDQAILKGRSSVNGDASEFLAGINLVDNAQTLEFVTGDGVNDSVQQALIQTPSLTKGVLLSGQGYSKAIYEYLPNGLPRITNPIPEGIFQVAGHNATADPRLGYNAVTYEDGLSQANGIEAVVGDFTRVHRGVTNIEVNVSSEATVMENGQLRSMFANNEYAFLIEVGFVAAVENPGAFTVVRNELETP